MKNRKWVKEIEKANGRRRTRTVTLGEIEKKIEEVLSQIKVKKKNLKYIKIQNEIGVCKSYKYRAYYTKWVVTLTQHGKIKTLEATEEQAKQIRYGADEVCASISEENIEEISKIKFTHETTSATIAAIERAILNGKI